MWPRGSSQWKQFTRSFDSCLFKNHKVNCRLSCCLCQKKEVHTEGESSRDVFLLNDSWWSKDLIPWHDVLLLLEDETVKLLAPNNIYSEDIVISTDMAIFATSKSPIKYRGPYNASDDRETDDDCQMEKAMSFAINFLQKSKKICILTQGILQN